MDFNDSPEEAEYRAKARAWLEKNVAEHKAMNHADDMAAGKAWQRRKAEAGYAQITWPKEWGGGGGTPIQRACGFDDGRAVEPDDLRAAAALPPEP